MEQKLGYFSLSPLVIDRFLEYAKLLVETNKLFNLTAITQPEDIVVKHFADSLYGSEFIAKGSKVADIGSGCGFPGLALAIARPDINVFLIESIGKKVGFLEKVILALDIQNATPLQKRAENAGSDKEFRESFDIVTARGLASLRVLAEYALPLLKVGGNLVAYKSVGMEEELQQAEYALSALSGKIKESKTFYLDGTHLRNITVIQKTAPTPKEYPRPMKKIKTNPL